MKKIKEGDTTMFQEFAEWLARDAGDRNVLYKTWATDKVFVIERQDIKPRPSRKRGKTKMYERNLTLPPSPDE